MLRLLTILLLSVATANAAIPIIFIRAGTNAVEDPNTNVVETSQFFVEAEDFDTDGDLYFPSNPAFGHNFNAAGLYNGATATEDDDFHSADSAANLYRSGTGVNFLAHDAQRPGRLNANADYAITNFSAGDPDWFSYRRNFAGDCCGGTGVPTNYHVYAYIASHGDETATTLKFDDVDPTTNALGTFSATLPAGGAFEYVPLIQNSTNKILTLTSVRRFRVTSDSDGPIRFHHLKLVVLEPIIMPGVATAGSTDVWLNPATTNTWINPRTGLAFRN